MARPSTTPAAARSHDDARFLRIQRVAELTGVPEVTLRAWERRYGIPSPERTSTGYRLYGEREVELVREMVKLGKRGLSAAQAAAKIKARSAPEAPTARAPSPADGSGASLAVHEIVSAVERFDDDALESALGRLTFFAPPIKLLDTVLAPALVAIGEAWASGKISVAQEHFASHRLGTFMRSLLRTLPGTTSTKRVVLACFGDDEHELGLVGFAMRLADWGARPVILGARTPPSAIAEARSRLDPVLIAFSATVAPAPDVDRGALCRAYAAAAGAIPWIVGGSYASSLEGDVRAAGGAVVGGDAQVLRARVEKLVATT